MNLQPLIDPNFWFNLQPHALSPGFDRAFFLFFSILIITGAVSRIVMRHKKSDRHLAKAYRMVSQMLLSMGLLGTAMFFFTYEEIYILGARFWFLLWGIGLVVWIVFIVRYAKKKIPLLRTADLEKNKENKYLPRKNRR